jgi:hypothetical protein
MSDHKSNYIAMKFKYSFLKFQTGGYNSNDAINLAAAAAAVINCANFDNKAVSVDCYDPTAEKITLEARLVTLSTTRDNLTGIKNAEARMKIEKEIADVRNQINVVQSRIGTSNVANRTCDKVLATVASIYLAIIHNKHDGLVSLINDLASKKINNCPSDKRTPEKRISVAKYYLNILLKLNDYLNGIGNNLVSFDAIFENAEYSKVKEGVRTINPFMLSGIVEMDLQEKTESKEVKNNAVKNETLTERRKVVSGTVKPDPNNGNKPKLNNFIKPIDVQHLIDSLRGLTNEQKTQLKQETVNGNLRYVNAYAAINFDNIIKQFVYSVSESGSKKTVQAFLNEPVNAAVTGSATTAPNANPPAAVNANVTAAVNANVTAAVNANPPVTVKPLAPTPTQNGGNIPLTPKVSMLL